jgi:diguanylate cyclase (GGDEF)-like protein
LPHLDLFTVRVMTVISVFIASLATLFASRINSSVAGMRLFALGLLSLCAGSALALMATVSPVRAIVIAATVFRIWGMISVLQGVRKFRGFPVFRGSSVAAVTAAFLGVFLVFGVGNFGMRVATVSFALAVLAADACRCMIWRVPVRHRLLYWPTGFAFAFASAYLMARTFAALSGWYGAISSSPAEPIEMATGICANITFVGCAFGMLLASNMRLKEEAETLAQFDSLTNLPNRRLLLDRLRAAEHRAVTSGRKLGVIYLDLDGFKLINDTLGHDVGDDFLRDVSALMQRTLGPRDCLARVGGDEFVVLVEDLTDRRDLANLAERLNTAVKSKPVSGLFSATMRASCGVAVFPDDGHTAREVMREADLAMYHAKRQRRVRRGVAAAV